MPVSRSFMLLALVARASAFPRAAPLLRRAPSRLMAKVTAEQVLANPQWPAEWPYSDKDFARMDEEVDTQFYNQPRLVFHIDDGAVTALTQYYEQAFKAYVTATTAGRVRPPAPIRCTHARLLLGTPNRPFLIFAPLGLVISPLRLKAVTGRGRDWG